MDVYKKFSEIDLKPWRNSLYVNNQKVNNPLSQFCPSTLKKFMGFYSVKCSRPVMIRIETVNICNNNCLICANQISKRKQMIMPLDLFEKILTEYSIMGGGKISLTPTGGDLFMDTLLVQRLNLINNFPKITGLSFTTNAVESDRYSDEELSNILSNFERIHISIYGIDDEEYQTMTRRNTYLRMINNINKLLKLKTEQTEIVFGFRFLKKRTNEEIDTWIQTNFSESISYGYTASYNNWGNGKITSLNLPFDASWIPEVENKSRCFHPLIAFQIFSNGDVSFCPCPDYDIDDELKLGNVSKNNLIQIFNSKKVQKFWDSSNPIPNYCKRCTAHKSFNNFGEIQFLMDHPSWVFGA
jgi:MoaA/NifB/PqqE/SkfB family radical SAM enzyme